MRSVELRGVRLVLWWLGVYTRTLPKELRDERRDELRADIHDQMEAGRADHLSDGHLSRLVALRAIKGVPADVVWRFEVEWERDRLAGLLSHPSTLLTFLFVLLLPVNLLWDALLDTGSVLQPAVDGLRAVMWALEMVVVTYVLAIMLFWLTSTERSLDRDRWMELTRTQRVLRVTLPAMFFFFALSGLWRFSPDPLGLISALAWALFGIALITNVVCLVIRRFTRTPSLHLEKVPS